jgi:hypothetical protein
MRILKSWRSSAPINSKTSQWLGETPQKLVREHLFANSPKEAKEFEEALKDVRPDPIKDVDWDALLEQEKVEL